MLIEKVGDMWQHPYASNEAITIAVNTIGVAGAGQAKQFKERYPSRHTQYVECCKQGVLRIGHPVISYGSPNFLFFPTKNHYRDASKLVWIERGLLNLILNPPTVGTVHLPALGCGLGGLLYEDMLALAKLYLSNQTVNYCIWRL